MKRPDNRNGEKRYKFYFPSFLQGIYSKFGLGALFRKKHSGCVLVKPRIYGNPRAPVPRVSNWDVNPSTETDLPR